MILSILWWNPKKPIFLCKIFSNGTYLENNAISGFSQRLSHSWNENEAIQASSELSHKWFVVLEPGEEFLEELTGGRHFQGTIVKTSFLFYISFFKVFVRQASATAVQFWVKTLMSKPPVTLMRESPLHSSVCYCHVWFCWKFLS